MNTVKRKIKEQILVRLENGSCGLSWTGGFVNMSVRNFFKLRREIRQDDEPAHPHGTTNLGLIDLIIKTLHEREKRRSCVERSRTAAAATRTMLGQRSHRPPYLEMI